MCNYIDNFRISGYDSQIETIFNSVFRRASNGAARQACGMLKEIRDANSYSSSRNQDEKSCAKAQLSH
jgi:hypothetical protein